MSVIARRLGEVYADVLPKEGRLLAAQTADAAKAAYLSGQAAADEALQLDRRGVGGLRASAGMVARCRSPTTSTTS